MGIRLLYRNINFTESRVETVPRIVTPFVRVGTYPTIRAGRNLPDKEFRYLRTVIVTAAVYRGFDSMRQVTLDISS